MMSEGTLNLLSSFSITERAPELTSVFTDQIKLADKRDSLSLKCSAEGVPLPQIRWFLDGVELYSNSHVRIESHTESLHLPIVGNCDGGGPNPGVAAASLAASSAAPSGPSSSMKAHHLSRSIISFVNITSLLLQVRGGDQTIIMDSHLISFADSSQPDHN